MKLSARNQLVGTVKSIKEGGVMAEIIVEVDGGIELVSVITVTSAHNLHLTQGSKVTVVIKSTEVMLATDE